MREKWWFVGVSGGTEFLGFKGQSSHADRQPSAQEEETLTFRKKYEAMPHTYVGCTDAYYTHKVLGRLTKEATVTARNLGFMQVCHFLEK